jgi:hypothetical protein
MEGLKVSSTSKAGKSPNDLYSIGVLEPPFTKNIK